MQHTPLIGTDRRRGEQVTKVGLIKNNKTKSIKQKKNQNKIKNNQRNKVRKLFLEMCNHSLISFYLFTYELV